MSFKERDDSFQKFRNFDPHSRLSDFRKRFQDLAQETNNRSNMLFDRHTNGWPLNPRHVYSMVRIKYRFFGHFCDFFSIVFVIFDKFCALFL
jgi:hypothetical protein